MKITITAKDITKNRKTVSASGMLIDELAYSAGEAEQNDIEQDFYAQNGARELKVLEIKQV